VGVRRAGALSWAFPPLAVAFAVTSPGALVAVARSATWGWLNRDSGFRSGGGCLFPFAFILFIVAQLTVVLSS
jgi:hypothetical protein